MLWRRRSLLFSRSATSLGRSLRLLTFLTCFLTYLHLGTLNWLRWLSLLNWLRPTLTHLPSHVLYECCFQLGICSSIFIILLLNQQVVLKLQLFVFLQQLLHPNLPNLFIFGSFCALGLLITFCVLVDGLLLQYLCRFRWWHKCLLA